MIILTYRFIMRQLKNMVRLIIHSVFGFVPLLVLGGFKDVNHLDKVKMYEHIFLITQFTGSIGD